MSDKKKYYDYLKKYDAPFLNKYESWSHYQWGRRSNYMQLLYARAYYLYSGRGILMHGWKIKHPFVWCGTVVCIADVFGIWFYQEMYNKMTPWKYVYYQPEWKNESTLQE